MLGRISMETSITGSRNLSISAAKWVVTCTLELGTGLFTLPIELYLDQLEVYSGRWGYQVLGCGLGYQNALDS